MQGVPRFRATLGAVSGVRSMVEKTMDVLANLGLVMRDTRREKLPDAARAYGPDTDGFRLSIHPVKPAPTVSVAIKNVGAEERKATLPGWLIYYSAAIVGPDGAAVPLTAFGRQLLEAGRGTALAERVFRPGEPVETEIPIGTLYDMRKPGVYRVTVSARSPGSGGMLVSNELTVGVTRS